MLFSDPDSLRRWLCWVFIDAQGLSLVVVSGGYSLVAVCGLLIVMASLVAEHALYRTRTSVDVTRGLSAVALELRLNSCGTWS